MNIKSLILGSATAALAVTGAQAADAIIIAEPEPVEYVRVCDVYGAGYFYIPGTETCLRVSGWVRHQMDTRASANLRRDRTIGGQSLPQTRLNVRDKGLNHTSGARIDFDARSETEYGTLRGWASLEGTLANTNNPTDIPISINRALIQLGGLYMGYADSLFSSSSNFGGSGLGNYGGFSFADTFDYHYNQNQQIGYQFNAGNGLWGAIALENNEFHYRSPVHPNYHRNYGVNVVGKVTYQQAWGGAWATVGYDEQARGVGVRGGVQGNFGALTARLDGYYRSKADSVYGPTINITGPWATGALGTNISTRWAVQATALYQINPKFGIAAGLGYYDNLVASGADAYTLAALPGPINGVTNSNARQFVGGHAWTAQLGLNWTPVQNFQVGADVIYRKAEVKLADNLGNTAKGTADATSIRLRFQRNF